jgi:hypothetical protein
MLRSARVRLSRLPRQPRMAVMRPHELPRTVYGLLAAAAVLLAFGMCPGRVAATSASAAATTDHTKVERSVAIKALIAKATPDALAAAALLKQFGSEDSDNGSYDLAARAAQLAPDRRDLGWLAIRMCGRATDCDTSAPEEHLLKIDPSNGVVWLRALTHSQATDDASAIDSALSKIANSEYVNVYFDPLVAATTRELAAAQHAGSSKPSKEEMGAAGQTMVGAIAASILPPLQPLSFSCKGTALESEGRLDLCRRVAKAVEHGDTFIVEGMGLSLQQRLWPLDSEEGRAITARRRILQYRLEEYGKLEIAAADPRKFPADMVEVFQAHEREQDAALVYFAKAGIPGKPPANWTSTMLPRVP